MSSNVRLSVSVVIPCYNRELTILSCLKSVLEQTYPPFEIIVVDDGSNDKSIDIIESLNEPRIKLIKQTNKGGSAARNTGISYATGDLISFLDSDDLFLPFHLEQAINLIEMKNSNFIYSQVIVRRSDLISYLKPPMPINSGENISEYLLSNRGFIQTSTIVVCRVLALKTLFDEKLKYGQDTDFAIRLVSNGAKIEMANEPSVIWADEWDEKRVSSKINYQNRIDWLNRIRCHITEKAYYADMGWPIAKGYRQDGMFLKSMSLFLAAAARRCYNSKLLITIFFQILLGNKYYRKFADILAMFGVKP